MKIVFAAVFLYGNYELIRIQLLSFGIYLSKYQNYAQEAVFYVHTSLFNRQSKLHQMWSLVTKSCLKPSSEIAAAEPFFCFFYLYLPFQSSFLIGIVKWLIFLGLYVHHFHLFCLLQEKEKEKKKEEIPSLPWSFRSLGDMIHGWNEMENGSRI